ncbi:MAG: hypothetical protein Q8Q62_10950, partial [Mesorhizobium sp.]|nr:hypothetical protein [Mesorhizobium sp.]
TIATYSDSVAEYWERQCGVDSVTALDNVYGVVLRLTCAKADDSGTYSRSELLLQLDDRKVASFPPLRVLKRCPSAK